ncbi:MAG: hypothetical protein FWE84_01630 [Firmicutes bacterium]|nr:hypothetical protein [Bacillota bacterium]
MKFVKRLVILSGERGKGTLALERNAYGVFVKLNAVCRSLFNLDLVVRIDGKVFSRRVSGDKADFSLDGVLSIEVVHAAVFSDGQLVMYGTNEPRRLLASEAEGLRAYIKKDKEAVFSTRGQIDGSNIIKLSYGETEREAAAEFLPPDERVKLDFTKETEKAGQETDSNDSKNVIEYEDEKLAEKNFYLERLDYDAVVNERLGGREMKADDFLKDYEVSPSLRVQAFLSGKASGTGFAVQETARQEFVRQELAEQKTAGGASPTTTEKSGGLKLFGQKSETQKGDFDEGRDFFSLKNSAAAYAEAAAAKVEPVQKPGNIKSFAAYNNSQSTIVQPFAQRGGGAAAGRVTARGSTFFERNGGEIEKLLKNPREEVLEKLLPGSRWVRINYDNSGRFYVVGLIGREFLCYGVPAEFSAQPPDELKGYCWWLPLIPDAPKGKGYWIMYQNLTTGETVYPK